MSTIYARAGVAPSPLGLIVSRDGTRANLDVLDVIGADLFGVGVTSKAVSASLDSLRSVSEILVRVNSPGGDAFEGAAIRSLLRAFAAQHEVPIRVEIHGLAASAASLIAMVGDTIAIAPDAMIMIHEAWWVAVGEAADMRHGAEILDKMNASMASIYAARSGLSVERVREMMAAETWLTADEAIDLGFADALLADAPLRAAPNERAAALADRFVWPPALYSHPSAQRLVAALREGETMDRQILAELVRLPVTATAAAITAAVADAVRLCGEYREQLEERTRQRDQLEAQILTQSVEHRITGLVTSGRATPAEGDQLRTRFVAWQDRGPLAVELYCEDLTAWEQRSPHVLTAPAVAPVTSTLGTVTDALRAEYGPGISDATILNLERKYGRTPSMITEQPQ